MCKWIWLRVLKRAPPHHHRSKSCKTVTCQSWRSEKKSQILGPGYILLSKFDFCPRNLKFFWPPTLTGYNSAAPWAMMIYGSSFESPKPRLFVHYLINSIPALLRHLCNLGSKYLYLCSAYFVMFWNFFVTAVSFYHLVLNSVG